MGIEEMIISVCSIIYVKSKSIDSKGKSSLGMEESNDVCFNLKHLLFPLSIK